MRSCLVATVAAATAGRPPSASAPASGDIPAPGATFVVYAANAALAGGGGVDDAIQRAAGWALMDELPHAADRDVRRALPLRWGARDAGVRAFGRTVDPAAGHVAGQLTGRFGICCGIMNCRTRQSVRPPVAGARGSHS